MESISRPMGPYKSAQKLKDCELEKEALEKQVEELKARLQGVENPNNNSSSGAPQRDKNHDPHPHHHHQQLPNELEKHVVQIKTLQKQVDNLRTQLVQEKTLREPPEELSSLQDEVRRVNDLLGQERAANFQEQSVRLQITKDLEKAKEQLLRMTKLKDAFVSKEKETRSELERLKRFSDTETIETMRIASEFGHSIRKKQKKVLLKDFEELKVSHMISQEKFAAQLQAEKDKFKDLMKQQEQLKDEVRQKVEEQKARRLQKGLEKGIQTTVEAEKAGLVEKLNAENSAMVREIEEVTRNLKKNACEKDEAHRKEMEDLKEDLKKHVESNQEIFAKLQAEEEVTNGLRMELAKLKDEQKAVASVEAEKEPTSMIHRMFPSRHWKKKKTEETKST